MAFSSSLFPTADNYFELLRFIYQCEEDLSILPTLRIDFLHFLQLKLQVKIVKERLDLQLAQFAAIKKISVEKIREDIQRNGENLKEIKKQFDDKYEHGEFDSTIKTIIETVTPAENKSNVPARMAAGAAFEEVDPENNNFDNQLFLALEQFDCGRILLSKGKNKDAIVALEQAIAIADTISPPPEELIVFKQELATALNNHGISLQNENNAKEALVYLERANLLVEAISFSLSPVTIALYKEGLCKAFNDYAVDLINDKKTAEAIFYIKKAIALAESHSSPLKELSHYKEALCIAFWHHANLLLDENNTRGAIFYLEDALKLGEIISLPIAEIEPIKKQLCIVLSACGVVLFEENNLREAIVYFEKAIKCAESISSPLNGMDNIKKNLYKALNNYGVALLAAQNAQEAIVYFERAVALAKTVSSPEADLSLYEKNLSAAKFKFAKMKDPAVTSTKGMLFSADDQKKISSASSSSSHIPRSINRRHSV